SRTIDIGATTGSGNPRRKRRWRPSIVESCMACPLLAPHGRGLLHRTCPLFGIERRSKRNLFSADFQEIQRNISTYTRRLNPVFVRCINALVMNADLMRADL